MVLRKGVELLFLFSVLVLQGCVALVVGAGAGAATVAYIGGELQTTQQAAFNRTWEASQGAMKDLEFKVNSSHKDATGGIIEAEKADGTKIKLKLKPEGTDTTSVKIRVGVFGDEDVSKLINRQISKRLGTR